MLHLLGQSTHPSLTGHRRPGVRKGVRVSPVVKYQEDSSWKRSQAPCLLPIRVLRDASTSPRKTDTAGPCITPLESPHKIDYLEKAEPEQPYTHSPPIRGLLSVYHLWFPTWPLQHFGFAILLVEFNLF